MDKKPDFVIIGAMKCATSTLHDQLARQAGVFMSTPKEPNFFSDEANWSKGLPWYESLFDGAETGAIRGESSTHYTKLPTYPKTVERFAEHLPDARLIYVMRDPIARIVSQYVHEWSEARVSVPIDVAVERHPELIDYSKYSMQLSPWMEAFGPERVLPVFFERMTARPQEEFERISRHIGCTDEVRWVEDVDAKNVSANRIRRSPWRDAVLDIGVVKKLRRSLLPESVRDRIKSRWKMQERPVLSPERRAWVVERLAADVGSLGAMLGMELTCETFRDDVLRSAHPPEWAGVPGSSAEDAGGAA